ncbi:MAG: GDP-mannose 4,6-dehydratase [Patescibacteria group bacterium]
MKTVLITGITGQDGFFLSRFLLEKGYDVHGIIQQDNKESTGALRYLDPAERACVHLHCGDVTDRAFIDGLFQEIPFDEIYHFAAQSSVGLSFQNPRLTHDVNIMGTLHVLNSLKEHRPQARLYFAATSEMFGRTQPSPQNEETAFHPRSPYGVSKLAGFWTVKNYREAYGLFLVNGILFNHESEYRGEEFVTKKIARAVARIANGSEEALTVGNLDAKRDWGYAGEYVDGMWRMLQQEQPDDYILATGKNHSVKDYISSAFRHVGMTVLWSGEGRDEVGIDEKNGRMLVRIDPKLFRPSEIDELVGDASKAERVLGWKAQVDFDGLVRIMVEHERRNLA